MVLCCSDPVCLSSSIRTCNVHKSCVLVTLVMLMLIPRYKLVISCLGVLQQIKC